MADTQALRLSQEPETEAESAAVSQAITIDHHTTQENRCGNVGEVDAYDDNNEAADDGSQ